MLWRAEAEALASHGLAALHRLLAPRGRLIAVVPAEVRRALLLELLGLGFVHLEEHEVNLLTSRVAVIALRREEFPVRALGETGSAAAEEAEILELFAPSFHVARSFEHWQWKYERNPWGRRQITVARSPAGELAAHYAGYPLPLVHHGGGSGASLQALQIGDTMTDPRFRQVGRGPTSLLGRCVRHFYTAFCEERVAFNFGFNTGNIQKFSMLFVGAHRIEPVGFWLAAGGGAAPETRLPRPPAKPRSGRFSTAFFERAAPNYGLLVRRDAAYLRWRYLECPDQPPFVILAAWRFFRMVGYAVFRRRGDHLVWADALFHPRHLPAAGDLLRHALALPEFAGVSAIEAWFPPRPGWFWPYLSELGFSARPEPHDLSLMLVPHREQHAADLVRDRFYYTMGDGDLI